LLKQMSEGSETDPQARIAELQRRRDEIDAEIARVRSGDLPMLDDTGLRIASSSSRRWRANC
jgi:hypothetical protein